MNVKNNKVKRMVAPKWKVSGDSSLTTAADLLNNDFIGYKLYLNSLNNMP